MSPNRRRRLFHLPFRKDGVAEEVDEELRFHVDQRAAKYESTGMTPEQARAAAERKFGDVERIRGEVAEMMRRRERAMQQSGMIDNARRDVAFAGRQIFRNLGFSSIAVLTIALAIGATTAIFSVVDGIMLRPLPFEQPEELVMIWADYTKRDVVLPDKRREWLSWPNFFDFRDEVSAVEAAAAFGGWGPTLTGAGDAEQLNGANFNYGMFSKVLGVEPALGRGFLPEEDAPDGPASVLISHGLWHRAFGGDPDILNTTIRLSDQPITIIGIMPADFRPPAFLGTDVWSTMQVDRSNEGGRGGAFLRAVGRLAEGSTLEVARGQATQLGLRLEEEYPEANQGTNFNVYPLQFDIVQQASTALWVLFGAVGFVLLIACVNVANLLLARGATRNSELAVRVAMGASRQRILSQLMTESLLLAGIGGALGIALSFVGTSAILSLAPAGTPLLDQVAVDGRILGFAAGITMLAGLLFGILPALRAARAQPVTALREGGRTGAEGRSARLRNTLVVGQIGLALMLLVGAGLLVRSFQNLRDVDLGFNADGVLSMYIQLPGTNYPDDENRREFYRTLNERLTAIPGVTASGSVSALPMAGFDNDTGFLAEGAPPPASGIRPSVWLRLTTPGYPEAMGLELLSGRTFTAGDDGEATRVIMVNETLERDYFEGQAVGKRLNLNSSENPVWREVVGVIRDIKHFGIRADSRNALYLPYDQAPRFGMFTVMRASVDPESLINTVRSEVADMDPGIAVARIQTMNDLVDSSLGGDRFTTSLLSGFAVVALILAVVGLYGVVSYSVSTRMREMGVRIALGAPPNGIRHLILRWSLALAIGGIVVGALGALAVTRLIDGLLFGVPATDLPTFGIVSVVMAVAAVLASVIPAVRATKVDPIKVLKAE